MSFHLSLPSKYAAYVKHINPNIPRMCYILEKHNPRSTLHMINNLPRNILQGNGYIVMFHVNANHDGPTILLVLPCGTCACTYRGVCYQALRLAWYPWTGEDGPRQRLGWWLPAGTSLPTRGVPTMYALKAMVAATHQNATADKIRPHQRQGARFTKQTQTD